MPFESNVISITCLLKITYVKSGLSTGTKILLYYLINTSLALYVLVMWIEIFEDIKTAILIFLAW